MSVQRIFGCGIDGQTFKAKYEVLSEENKLRLGRVANRVRLTLTLRYEMAFYGNPFLGGWERYELGYVELPSIEVYLLCTCLDTLAGKPVYKNFKDWIKEQPSIIDWGLEEVVCLYTQYEKEYGVGRNLRALFKNLPQSVKDWLSSNVVIHRLGQSSSAKTQNADKLVNRLYMYFYNVRRNAFTHGGVSLPTVTADVSDPTDEKWWVSSPSGTHFVLDRNRPNQQWNLLYRQGLDEATILRIIVHAAGLQLLGIDSTQELIDTNLRNYSRLAGLHAFVSEVKGNSASVSWWAKIDDSGMTEFRLHLIYAGIPILGSDASAIMVDRYLDNPLESGLRQMTLQYIREVNHINSVVSDFNESNPPDSDDRDQNKRWQVVKEFLNELVETPSYNSILTWASRKEMANLWLIIRDPCYTPSTI